MQENRNNLSLGLIAFLGQSNLLHLSYTRMELAGEVWYSKGNGEISQAIM